MIKEDRTMRLTKKAFKCRKLNSEFTMMFIIEEVRDIIVRKDNSVIVVFHSGTELVFDKIKVLELSKIELE